MRSSGSLRRAATVAALLASLAAGGPARADRIHVAREATVSGGAIELGDLAVLEGERAAALGALRLGQAPAAGESRTLDGHAVLAALRREAGDLAGITYSIPPTIRVRRATQEVGEATIRTLIEGFLGEALGAGASDAVLRAVELPGPVRIPAGTYTVRVVPPAGAPLLGRVRLQLEFAVDGRPAKSVWVVADVALYGPVLVATRSIARGEVLAAADVSVDQRDLSQVPRGIVTEVAEAAGRVARVPLMPYAPIRREHLEAPVAVRRGDVVLLVAERGGLRITAPGEVRGDAGIGDQVHVTNRLSRKDVIGRVVDPSTVAVEF